jgi:catechol 2,3-dioxygenase-like lactoylglutathione lyase family enzyme
MSGFDKVLPVLRVTDMQRAVGFYTGLLGFEVCWRSPNDGGGENCMLRAGAVELLLSTGSHLGDRPQFSGTLYFATRGVQELYDRIRDRVQIVWPPETMEYGQREFGIRDADGYTLASAEGMKE